MPPTLHPRSRQTVSLFTATLAISFFVVGLPHVLPCPVPARAFADSGDDTLGASQKRRRRRKCAPEGDASVAPRQISAGEAPLPEDAAYDSEDDGDIIKRKRECPVPKPGGLVGQILGFEKEDRQPPRSIIVESVRARRARAESDKE